MKDIDTVNGCWQKYANNKNRYRKQNKEHHLPFETIWWPSSVMTGFKYPKASNYFAMLKTHTLTRIACHGAISDKLGHRIEQLFLITHPDNAW